MPKKMGGTSEWLENINSGEISQRSTFQHQDLALPNSLQTPVLETLGQIISKTGTQSHPKKEKKRQEKNMLQTKEQGKNLQNQIYEEKNIFLSFLNYMRKEFRVMTVKMIQNHKKIECKQKIEKI